MSQTLLIPAPVAPGWQADLLRDRGPQWTPPPIVGVHLAILVEPYLSRIMDGTKTIESRWSMNRSIPFGAVAPGDVVILKLSGGPVRGVVTATGSRSIALTGRDNVAAILTECGAALGVDGEFLWVVAGKKFVTLIDVSAPVSLDGSAIRCGKKGQAGWVVLRERA